MQKHICAKTKEQKELLSVSDRKKRRTKAKK